MDYINQTVPVTFADGSSILIEVRNSPRQQVSSKSYSIEKITDQLKALSAFLKESLQESKPDKISVEVGIELSVESGELTALFIKGNSTTNFKVTLEWEL